MQNEQIISSSSTSTPSQLPLSNANEAGLQKYMENLNEIEGIQFCFTTNEVAELKATFDCIANIAQEGNLMFDKKEGVIQVKVLSQAVCICSEIRSPAFFCKKNTTVGVSFITLSNYIGKAVKGETVTIMGTTASMNEIESNGSDNDQPHILVLIDSPPKRENDAHMTKWYKLPTMVFSIDAFPTIESVYDLVLQINSTRLTKHLRSIGKKEDKLVQFLVNKVSDNVIEFWTRVSNRSNIDLDNLFKLELKVSEKVNSVNKMDQYSLSTINCLLKASMPYKKMITLFLKCDSRLLLKIEIGKNSFIHALVSKDSFGTPISLEQIREQNKCFGKLSTFLSKYNLMFNTNNTNNNSSSDKTNGDSSSTKNQSGEPTKRRRITESTELDPDSEQVGEMSEEDDEDNDDNDDDAKPSSDSDDDDLENYDVATRVVEGEGEEEELLDNVVVEDNELANGRGLRVEGGGGTAVTSSSDDTPKATAPKRRKHKGYKTQTPAKAKSLAISNAEAVNELLSSNMSERSTLNINGSNSGQEKRKMITPSDINNLTTLNAVDVFRKRGRSTVTTLEPLSSSSLLSSSSSLPQFPN